MIVGASLAVASLAVVPGVAGADAATNCVTAGSVTEPGNCVTTPTVAGGGQTTDPTPAAATPTPAVVSTGSSGAKTVTTSSLPFTGADVAELAVLGTGAVLAGSLLARRRRRAIA